MRRLDVRRIVLAVAAPLIAIGFALLVTALVLVATGDPVWGTAQAVGFSPRPSTRAPSTTSPHSRWPWASG